MLFKSQFWISIYTQNTLVYLSPDATDNISFYVVRGVLVRILLRNACRKMDRIPTYSVRRVIVHISGLG